MDLTEGYAEYGERGECSDVTLESYRWSSREEDPLMEVEEVTGSEVDKPSAIKAPLKALPRVRRFKVVSRGKFPPPNDVIGSEEDEPPAPKALPRARHSGVSKQPRVTDGEATSAAEEDIPPPRVRTSREQAPTPNPRGGKTAAAPGIAQQTGTIAVLVFPPALLLALARSRLPGPLALPFRVGLGSVAR
ncbi:hypothetical protein P4O66_001327 [Electrophorus voltai]|uniref:Uncharacterized protein n=1 Tax=Electrophorus voltai TaxID=2609070 RepID=A0AAD8Z842_9TELE|nr:hypothetical protein P4O66_001327 [Electrophorus voltai]